MHQKKKKYLTKSEALKKLQRYCVYQDRCHSEVRSKLLDLGIYGDDLEEVIVDLIEDNFLNEERFARSYARGKFRFKYWGRIKITQELKRRKISAYLIRKAMEEIDPDDYIQELYNFLERKNRLVKAKNDFERRQKLAAYAFRRGFESDLVWETVKQVTAED